MALVLERRCRIHATDAGNGRLVAISLVPFPSAKALANTMFDRATGSPQLSLSRRVLIGRGWDWARSLLIVEAL